MVGSGAMGCGDRRYRLGDRNARGSSAPPLGFVIGHSGMWAACVFFAFMLSMPGGTLAFPSKDEPGHGAWAEYFVFLA